MFYVIHIIIYNMCIKYNSNKLIKTVLCIIVPGKSIEILIHRVILKFLIHKFKKI